MEKRSKVSIILSLILLVILAYVHNKMNVSIKVKMTNNMKEGVLPPSQNK